MRIGIVGYGRFGSALASLLEDRGHPWCGWDAAVKVTGDRGVADLDSLVSQSDMIVVAVPVSAFESLIRGLRPMLGSRHTVMDVCSVKQGPCQLMDEVFGDEIAHVGCHPLFGPLSIARAESLRTVLCPSPRHPEAGRRARVLFESLGSEVSEQDPAGHDRFMASTHAMAFFIARGLLDLGIGEDLRWAPPSFAALAASIAAVRADAGHLFNAIQRDNPYAATTRRQFIEALTSIDQRLAQEQSQGSTNPEVGIPGLGLLSPTLLDANAHLEELDREMAALAQRRQELMSRTDSKER